jgi:outer membrane receptor protein involved in Fe transport
MRNKRRLRKRAVFGAFQVCLLLLLASPVALAQSTATLLGKVQDASGGVLPGVTVTARHVATGVERTVVTGASGDYRAPALPVGAYEVRAELSGFRTEVRTGITLTVGQEAVIDFSLAVGALSETLTVTGEAPLVNTTSAALGSLVDAARIESLPLLGRNSIDLTLMQPGVVEHNFSRGTARVGQWFSARGASLRSNNFLLDGTMTNTLHGAGNASYSENTLGLDGIQEYRVLTSSYGAEYGMRMGSQSIMVSKSGTNALHGSTFEYFRDQRMKAKGYFDTGEKPDFSRHNFGGSLGGPIVHNKVFFFGTVEAVRERLGQTEIFETIPAAARVDGGLVPTINPFMKPFLDLYPAANSPDDEYHFLYTQPTNEYYVQGKIDYNFANSSSLFVRWTHNKSERTEVVGLPDFLRLGNSRSHYTTASYNWVMSPTLVSTTRAGYSFTRQGYNPTPESEARFTGPQYSYVTGRMMGGMNPAPGVTSIGGNSGVIVYGLDVPQFSTDFFDTRGRHSLKYGTLITMAKPIITLDNAGPGSIAFSSLANFLEGGPVQSYTAGTPGSVFSRTYRYNTFGFYLQDDMRLTDRFTLNAGLRYEFNTVPNEIHGRNSCIKDIRTWTAPELDCKTLKQSSLKNWSPRLGFAWDVRGDGRTAIRGGTGLLYDIGWMNSNFIEHTTGGPPFATQSRVNNAPSLAFPLVFPAGAVGTTLRTLDWNAEQPYLLEYTLALDQEMPGNIGLAVAYAGSRGYSLPTMEEGNPRVPTILEDGTYFWPANAPVVNPAWADVLWKSSNSETKYNSLQLSLIKRMSSGLQFQSAYTLAKMTSNNINAQLNGDQGGSGSAFKPNPYTDDPGPVQWDLRHLWSFNAIYDLPDPSSGNVWLSGWQVSTIVTLKSGFPLTPRLNLAWTNANGPARTNTDRPNVVPGVNLADITKGVSRGCLGVAAGTPVGTPELWFDPCAFTKPAQGFLGDAERGSIRGPGYANVNLSIVKDTTIGGSRHLQFRAEVFNVLNRSNFALPDGTVFQGRTAVEAPLPNVGRITELVSEPRQLQLSTRITF